MEVIQLDILNKINSILNKESYYYVGKAMQLLYNLNMYEKRAKIPTFSKVNGVYFKDSSWENHEPEFSISWWTIGVCYIWGIGVKADFKKANYLFEYAVMKSPCSINGWYYKLRSELKGTLYDKTFACCLISAVASRVKGTQFVLGNCYLHGEGAFRLSLFKAMECFKFGASEGCQLSKLMLNS